MLSIRSRIPRSWSSAIWRRNFSYIASDRKACAFSSFWSDHASWISANAAFPLEIIVAEFQAGSRFFNADSALFRRTLSWATTPRRIV
ncbi:MAG: hypothetical protein BWY66_00131 [bacterium ADurb.Bin374]|nr:MAG: hypothetical protein BWY66_00131 [bacterium ADurb.Bin374]